MRYRPEHRPRAGGEAHKVVAADKVTVTGGTYIGVAMGTSTGLHPQWLPVDLQKPVKLDRVHVFTYWGEDRYYQYIVEVSTDGKTWNKVADMSKEHQARHRGRRCAPVRGAGGAIHQGDDVEEQRQ